MRKEEIKSIIDRFFGKKYSEEGRRQFGTWMRTEVDTIEKEKALESLWNDSAHATQDITNTRNDWSELRQKIQTKTKKRGFYLPVWTKYAAVFALILLSATITWLARDLTPVLSNINMLQCFAPVDKSTELTLPDGTKVWINAGSLLVYPESFENTTNRSVYLTGEAFFSVTENPHKPFIVKTSQIDIQALGTQFTVEAYPNEEETRTTLEEGSVKVDIKTLNKHPFILKPSQQLIYNQKNDSISIHQVDLDQFRMARAGYLIFENASFTELIHGLERRYQVTIHYNSNKYIDGNYNVKFAPNETLNETLEVLKELMNIKYKIKEKAVYIK